MRRTIPIATAAALEPMSVVLAPASAADTQSTAVICLGWFRRWCRVL